MGEPGSTLDRRTFLGLLAWAAATPALAGPRGRARRLEALFTGLHAAGAFDGAVVVGHGEEVVFEGAYGLASVEDGARFTPDTPADGASLAKTFTAALVWLLVRERALDLDAPVRRLLPELPFDEVTLRHLLSHSSGLPASYGFADEALPSGQVRTTELLLRALAERRRPLSFAPGSRFEYSSFGYDLAALAAARAAGTSTATIFRERLFDPLGLNTAFLRPGRFSEWPGVRTRGYRRVDGRLEPNEVFELEAFHGGSNVYLSARDLHRWNSSFLTRPLLDPATLSRASEPAVLAEGRSGLSLLSWYGRAGGAEWYCGHLQGFHDVAFREHRSATSIVYVSNNTLEPWLHHAIVRAVRDLLAGRPPERLEPPAISRLPRDVALLAGRWRAPGGAPLLLEAEDSSLRVRSSEGVRYRAFVEDATSLYVPGLDLVLGCALDGSGAVSRLRVSSNLAAGWATRA